jgi:hypothetical protein
MDGHGETSIPPYNFVAGAIVIKNEERDGSTRSMSLTATEKNM